jgi:hypothetical protein
MRYKNANGWRALYQGVSPLTLREFIYISTITVINPIVTSYATAITREFQGGAGGSAQYAAGVSSAFACGFAAGLISAPCQTINVLMKDERHKGKRLRTVFQEEVLGNSRGAWHGIKRLFFGAGTRSARCGCAGVLYYGWRQIVGESSNDA